jgi:exodeoxyribonuclease V alpha subunit
MSKKGNKHRCGRCGKSYYDLGKQNHSCPACKQVGSGQFTHAKTLTSKRTKLSSNRQINKTLTENQFSTELFFVEESEFEEPRNTLSGNAVTFETNAERSGWFVGSFLSGSTSLDLQKDALWIGEFPRKGMKAYLSSDVFLGVGQQTAQKIVNTLNNNELMSLLRGDSFEFENLNIAKSSLNKIAYSWKQHEKTNAWSVLMHEIGFSNQQQKSARKELGSKFIPLLRASPYKLIGRIPRFSFDDATHLCARFGIKISDEDKALEATNFWLEKTEADRRHTCAPTERVVTEINGLVNLGEDVVAGYLNANASVFHFGERRGKGVISTRRSADRDEKILLELRRIIRSGKELKSVSFDSKSIETSKGIDLSQEQVDAINLALNNPVSVITGGPGAGKTTMVQGLVSALKQLGKNIRICAPTGRAAKRIAETPRLSSFNPSTIHMYLTKLGSGSAKQDFMIVDESSMIDLELMLRLLESIPDKCSLVFIGDPDQLPPVGSGQPFKDMIESDTIPVARLTGNFRQNTFSETVKAARAVIGGNVPIYNDDISSSDFVFIEKPAHEQCDTIMHLYFDVLPSMLGNHFTDNQILAPQRPGHVGITRLNAIIQTRISSRAKPVLTKKSGNAEVNIYVGDKVINRENNYELGVMNGDVGTVLREKGSELVVEFEMPGRSKHEVIFPAVEKYNLDLAYALTVHSSQGSEYPGVIIPVTSAHSNMLSRNLLYTAITRGKRQVCVVGERAAFEKAIALYMKDFRYTLLGERLKEEFG